MLINGSPASPADAIQVRNAYAQHSNSPPASSASGSNTLPLPSPAQLAARRFQQASSRPLKRSKKGYIDCGGYAIPRPPAPFIGGRDSSHNKGIAEVMKAMLDSEVGTSDGNDCPRIDDEANFDVANVVSRPIEGIAEKQAAREGPAQSPQKMSSTLADAFRDQFHGVHRSGDQDYDCLQPLPHAGPVHPWLDVTKLPPPVVTRPVKRKGNTLSLPGIDAKRQRNRYGRGHTAGQETGVGVIGSGVTTTTDDDDAQSSTQLLSDPNGCDGPTYTFDNYSITPTAGLDADMPPLAVEHPARVWNSLIQSLPTRIQPIIKWMYEKAHVDNIVSGWEARLTLALPPSHPALAEHPLRPTLPNNKYVKEYLKVVELLGGAKSWSGEPKRLKADAANVTLVKCMEDRGLDWIRDPTNSLVIIDSETDENDHADAGADGQSDIRSPVEADEVVTDLDAIVCDDVEVIDDNHAGRSDDIKTTTTPPSCPASSSDKPQDGPHSSPSLTGDTHNNAASQAHPESSQDRSTEQCSNVSESAFDQRPIKEEVKEEVDEKPLTACQELQRQIDAAQEPGEDVKVRTIITTRELPSGAGRKYGAYVFLTLKDRAKHYGNVHPVHRSEEDAVRSACADGCRSNGIESYGFNCLLSSLRSSLGAQSTLQYFIGLMTEGLLPGKKATSPGFDWMIGMIQLVWESGRILPAFASVLRRTDDGSLSQRGQISLGAETIEGPERDCRPGRIIGATIQLDRSGARDHLEDR